MVLYNYTISGNMNNNHPNLGQLREELISLGVIGISQQGDDIYLEFPGEIDTAVLESMLTSHVADYSLPKDNFYTYTPRKNSISSSLYQILGGQFKYGGASHVGPINYLSVIAYKDPEITSYNIRIYDSTNNLTLAEKTGITNNEPEEIDLGTVANVPNSSALLEVHAQRVGGSSTSKVYVEQAIVYHNN
jgi:hypothetical protein